MDADLQDPPRALVTFLGKALAREFKGAGRAEVVLNGRVRGKHRQGSLPPQSGSGPAAPSNRLYRSWPTSVPARAGDFCLLRTRQVARRHPRKGLAPKNGHTSGFPPEAPCAAGVSGSEQEGVAFGPGREERFAGGPSTLQADLVNVAARTACLSVLGHAALRAVPSLPASGVRGPIAGCWYRASRCFARKS